MINKFVSIIILNWNGKEDTKECLRSLESLEYKNFEVILVDNGSTDGSSVELDTFIKSNKFPFDIKFIKNKENLGFTGGNIEGLKHVQGKCIVLLNNDTVVDSKWLGELVKTAERDKKIGVVGGKAYMWNDDNPKYSKKNQFYSYQKVDPWLGYAHTLLNIKETAEVDSISGCAVLIKKEVIDKVGFLDPIFFAYYEETDLFARAIRAGYKVAYNPKAAVWHQVAKSSGGLSYFYLYQMLRNRAIFAIRNFDLEYYKYFIKDYFYNGSRAFWGVLIKGKKNVERTARADAFLWILKNWSKLYGDRKKIVNRGGYNNKLSLYRDESVSVIIPNYNYGKHISEAIESALKQSVKPLEIIVVDDGSTDNSIEVIKKYPVKLIRQKNSGVIEAKNNGFNASNGRFVLFLDADDILDKNAIREYLKKYKLDKSVGFVYSNMTYFGAEKGIFEAQTFNKSTLRSGNYIHNSALIKREAFLAVGGYAKEMSGGYEDWDLYLSLVENGYRGEYVPKSLLKYRRHDNAMSRNEMDQNKALELIYIIYQRHRKLFPVWYVLIKKVYNKAYYGYGKVSLFLKLLFFIFRLIHKFFTLIRLFITFRWREVVDKIIGEMHFWKALIQRKNR